MVKKWFSNFQDSMFKKWCFDDRGRPQPGPPAQAGRDHQNTIFDHAVLEIGTQFFHHFLTMLFWQSKNNFSTI